MDIRDSRTRRLLFTILLFALVVPNGIAQSSKDDKAAAELREAKDAKQNDGQITMDATSHKESAPVSAVDFVLSVDGAPSMGSEKAPLAIVEFGDYECPYCSQHANQVLPQIVTDYVEAGKVRYFFKDFPLGSIHPEAFKGAEAARCAGEQGKYWEMHDRLFGDRQPLAMKVWPVYLLALGLDASQFLQCLDEGKYGAQIRKDIQEAEKYHVPGTPSFYLGTLNSDGSGMKAVRMLRSFTAYNAFRKTLDQMLSSQGEQNDKFD